MPKKIDPKIMVPCVQQMLDHVAEYLDPTAAARVGAKRNGVGAESFRCSYVQEQVDAGQLREATTEDSAETKNSKVKVCRLEEDNDIQRRTTALFAGELDSRD